MHDLCNSSYVPGLFGRAGLISGTVGFVSVELGVSGTAGTVVGGEGANTGLFCDATFLSGNGAAGAGADALFPILICFYLSNRQK